MVAGQRYAVYQMPTALIALKAGDHPLAFDLEVLVADPSDRRGWSPFDTFSSFFDRFHLEPHNLHTPTHTFSIQSLPQSEQPDAFTGAIWLFSLQSHLSDKSVKVGEPLTLKVDISGEGNFERIQTPTLSVRADWKTYLPKAVFHAKDDFGYQGVKTFEYILIPKNQRRLTRVRRSHLIFLIQIAGSILK